MSNWIAFIFPSSAHGIMLLSFVALVFFAVPTNQHQDNNVDDDYENLLSLNNILQRRDYAVTITKKYITQAGNFSVQVIIPLVLHWIEHVRGCISSSLPDVEETAFEEQFKYLIVTSSLLSELPSTNSTASSTSNNTMTRISSNTGITTQNNLFNSMLPGMITIAAATSFLLLIASYLGVLPDYFSLTCLVLASQGLAFFILRRLHRRTKIRSIHTTALVRLRQLVAQCEQGDTALLRLVDQIRQLELISQGSTLAPPNHYRTRTITSSSFLSSTPTSSSSSSSRRAADMRRSTSHILHSQFRKFADALSNLEPLSHSGNLSRFRDMYNINNNASFSPLLVFDDRILKAAMDNTDELEHLMHTIHWKRRECVIHLLALDVMTLGHDSERVDYEQNWESVIEVISELVADYRRHNPLLHEHLTSSSLYSEEEEDERKILPGTVDQRSQALLHQYTALEKHVRSIQSKLLLCRQDAKAFSTSRAAAAYSMERIGERFGAIDQDLSHMLAQWEDAKDAYMIISDNDSSEDLTQILPSPPSSPKKADSSGSSTSSTAASRRAHYRRSMMTGAAVSSFLENKRASRQLRTRAQISRSSLISSPSTETL
ncbi:hypothetical protein BDA99DRAFT_515801 [Phascolomyces articulosus]|uniref:Myosin-binding domain-containing protein n=1 Tax=Phascolomyces articulosus TaxID=60185 RepID=A0AAD5PC60_9FUNG|nr:hypothetical protein BDA99DRAFT_515801 [Phascolomyces articulosus]